MSAVDIVILLLVVLLLAFALRGTIKHFKGEGPCCGGGSGSGKKAAEKALSHPAIGTKTLHIQGMHCDHCVQSVTSAINQIDGAAAKVNLQAGTALVSYDREISNAALKAAVEKAGFQVISMEG